MPTLDYMNAITQGVGERMSAVSSDAQTSLQQNSFVDSLNLTRQEQAQEETRGAVDALLNLGASAVEGATRTVGEIAALPANIQAASLLGVPDDIVEAYAISRDPNASEEQRAEAKAKLGQPVRDVDSKGKQAYWQQAYNIPQLTYGQKIRDAVKASEDARKIVDAISVTGLVKQGNRKELEKDLSQSFATIEEAWKNDDVNALSAAATSVAETVKALVSNPLAVGEYAVESIPTALTGILGSAGYGANVFNEALAKYQKENDGKLPSSEDMQTMALWSTGAAALDKIGDAKLVKAITESSKGGVKGVAKKLVGTTVTEGSTEAAQEVAEAKAKQEEVDAEAVYKAGAIGAAAGTTISGAGEVTSKVAGSAKKGTEALVQKNKETVSKINEQKAAVESGDVSGITDTTAETYSLKRSVETLSKAAAKHPEKRQEYYETAKEQTLTKRAELMGKRQELLELGTKETPTQEDATRVAELEKEIEVLSPEVDSAVTLVQGMKPEVIAKPEEVETDVQTATTVEQAPEVKAEAAKRVFNSFRQESESITADQAEAIAEADNGLTERENNELRAYAEVQRSLESLDTVGSHIVDGGLSKDTGREMLGIKDYRDMIMSGNANTAKAGLQGLSAFGNRHLEKLTKMRDAYAQYKATKVPQKVAIGSGKTLTIDARSRRLINTVQQEVNALQNAYQSFSKVYAETPTEAVSEDTTVQDTTVTTPVEQTPTAVEIADATPDVGVSSPVVAPVVPERVKDYSLAKEVVEKADANNLVAQYFKPSNKKSPLNKVNDFAQRLKLDTENTLAEFYPEGVPTEATVVANNFAAFNDSFVHNLDTIFEPVSMERGDFRSDDYLQFFVDENGQLPANIKTALAVGAYEWMIANGKESTFKSQDSIRNLLGLTEEDYVAPALYEVIPTGTRRTSIINSMGTAAFRSLNFKMAPDAPVDAQTRLETAMGLWTYETLRKANVLQEAKPIKASEIKNIYGVGAPKAIQDLDGAEQFVMTTLNLTPGIQKVIDTNRVKSSFMMDVFGSMSERPMPAFKPMKGTYKVSRSTQQVPEAQRKVLEEDQKKPYYLRADTVGSFFEMSPDLRLSMMGYDFNIDKTMNVRKGAVEGKNRSIERELEIAQEWYQELQNQDNGIETPFYLAHTVWKQGRMGIANRFNPQSSKIHRYLTNRGEWNHKFDFGSDGETYFLLAVAEGFDIEVPKFSTDSQGTSSGKALAKLDSVLAKEDIRNAIEAMKKFMLGDDSREVQEAIAAGVKAGEGNMKSYLSIVEMAKYENAKERGDTSFTHTLAREVDGITNGVCITTLQFAHDNFEQMFKLLQRMGIYDTDLTYNEWQANPANKDSYKSLAEAWQRAIEVDVAGNSALQNSYVQLSKLFGSFGKMLDNGEIEVTSDGRKISKGPLMTSIYGAGIGTIVDHLGNQAIDKIYDNLQKAYNTKNTQLVRETLATVQGLTGTKYVITKGTEILDFELKKADVKKIKQAVANVYQAPLKDAMEQEYAVSFNSRTQLNAAANFAHSLFMAMYENELAKYEVVTNEVQKEVLERLKSVTPIVNTANSKMSSKDLDTQLNTGLMLSGFEMVPAPKEVKVTIKGNFGGKKSSTSGGMLRTFKAPGAAPIPTMTQSVDAATQVQMLKNATVLNVHDASYISGNNFGKDKSVYNQGFLSVNYQYSIPQEIAQMLSRVVTGFQQSGLEIPADALKTAAKTILNTDKATLEQITSAINGLATDHMDAKKEVMKRIVRSEQYSNGDDSAYVPTHKLGSSQRGTEEYAYSDTREIDNMVTENVFDELQKLSVVKDSDEHLEHLRTVLTDVVNQTVTPFNLHIASSTETETIGSTNGADMYIVNQVQGALPQSGSLANGIRMSASEVFVHELVHNVSMVGVEQKFAERNELVGLWQQAKKVVTVRDFMNDPHMSELDPAFKDEYAAAEQRWKHVFEPTKSFKQGSRYKSQHLHEFVALGMTNENFRRALNEKVKYQSKAQLQTGADGSIGRLLQSLYNWFSRLLANLNSRLMSTYGKTGDKQLEELFKAFAGVDSSAKNLLKAKARQVVKPAERFVSEQVERAIDSVYVEPLKKFAVKAQTKVVEAAKSGKVQTIADVTKHGYDKLAEKHKTAANVFMSVATEMAGRTNYMGVLHDMKRWANKNIDRYRMQVRSDYRAAINEAFAEKLTPEQKSALSHVLIKTDVAALLDSMSPDQVITLVQNPSELKKEIAKYESQLKMFEGFGNFYIRQAKGLGMFMITGKAMIENQLLNAQNIADAIGSHRATPAHAPQVEPMIDTLASLYALNNLSDKHRNDFMALVSQEVSRGTENGISFSMNLVKELRKRSKEEFKDNSRHIQKGFMADKVDPNIAVKAGTLDEQADMEAQGYALGAPLPRDPNDPETETKYLYVNKMGGMTANIGGVAYLMTETSRGTDVVVSPNTSSNVTTSPDFIKMKAKTAKSATANWTSVNLSSRTYAVPLVNQDGEIINYRYVMNDTTKDEVLYRDTSFDDVMGIMFSGLAVKDSMRNQNKELVDVLREMYRTDTDNRDDYVTISPRATDPELREIWRMLPKEFKDEAKKVWGVGGIQVRKDTIDLLFGYRKYTLANMWQLPKEERNAFQKVFVQAVSMVFGDKAAMRVRQGEELMTALATTVKDIIVIKTGLVTLGNIMSNIVLLKMQGVPLVDILKGHKDSFVAMRRYKDQNKELEQLRIKLASASLSANQRLVYERRLTELEDDIANNPVINLIDEGLLSTIVEDVDTEVQEYKLRQRVKRKITEVGWADRLEDATNRIPQGLRDVAKEALAMQGSNLYDLLSETAQFSDFGARYVLYKHMTETKGVDPKVAAGEVMDVFIDYDLPTHQGLQYLNDLGLLMFTKYILRVQKIILKTIKDNPARALVIMLLQNWFGDLPDIVDSTMFIETNPLTRLANPLESFMQASPDIITLKAFS